MDRCLLIPVWFGVGFLIIYLLFWFDWTPVLAWIRRKRKPVYTNANGATGPNPWPGVLKLLDAAKAQQWKNFKSQHYTPGERYVSSPLNMSREDWVKYKAQFGVPPDLDMETYFISPKRYGKTSETEVWARAHGFTGEFIGPDSMTKGVTGTVGMTGIRGPEEDTAGYTNDAEGKIKRLVSLLNGRAHYSLLEQMVAILREKPEPNQNNVLKIHFPSVGKLAYFVNHHDISVVTITLQYTDWAEQRKNLQGPTGPEDPNTTEQLRYTFGKRPTKNKKK